DAQRALFVAYVVVDDERVIDGEDRGVDLGIFHSRAGNAVLGFGFGLREVRRVAGARFVLILAVAFAGVGVVGFARRGAQRFRPAEVCALPGRAGVHALRFFRRV